MKKIKQTVIFRGHKVDIHSVFNICETFFTLFTQGLLSRVPPKVPTTNMGKLD